MKYNRAKTVKISSKSDLALAGTRYQLMLLVYQLGV